MKRGILSERLPEGFRYYTLRDKNAFPRNVRNFLAEHLKDALTTDAYECKDEFAKMCAAILYRIETSTTYCSPKQLDVILRFVRSLPAVKRVKIQQAVVRALDGSPWINHVLDIWYGTGHMV